MPTTVQGVATTVESVLESIMQVEPTVASLIQTFGGPPAAAVVGMVQPEVLVLVPLLENALKRIAGTDDVGGQIGAVIDLAKHLLPGQPNSPALAPEAQPA